MGELVAHRNTGPRGLAKEEMPSESGGRGLLLIFLVEHFIYRVCNLRHRAFQTGEPLRCLDDFLFRRGRSIRTGGLAGMEAY